MENNEYLFNVNDKELDLLSFCLRFTKDICKTLNPNILKAQGIEKVKLISSIDNFMVKIGDK